VRALKVGGLLKLAVPDFEWIVREYFAVDDPERKGLLRAFAIGGQVDEHDSHKSTWTPKKLRELMDACGLEQIDTWNSEIQDCAALPVSLNLQGRKAAIKQSIQTGATVAAVMSMPRLTFSANMHCALMAFAPLRIPVLTHTGVFWGQCLTKGLKQAIGDGAELVFTVDNDTVFTRQDVEYMVGTMREHAEFDALMGVQIKRGATHLLFTMANEDGSLREIIRTKELAGEFVRCASGHFGLTCFRAAKLAELPHPWFLHIPGPEGEWTEGRIDEDMYFWKNWREHGRSLWMANKVRLGHIEEGITWPGRDFSCIFQNMADFRAGGMSKEAQWSA